MKTLTTGLATFGVFALLSAPAPAATISHIYKNIASHITEKSEPAAGSNTEMLADLREAAGRVSDRADILLTETWSSSNSLQSAADQLQQIKDNLNSIAPTVERLNSARLSMPADEKEIFGRVLPEWVRIAHTTQKAIEFVTQNPTQAIVSQEYRDMVSKLTHDSWDVYNTLTEYHSYARARSHERKLKSELGIKSAS